MNRRGFLTSLFALSAAELVPGNRVYSFPTNIVIPDYGGLPHLPQSVVRYCYPAIRMYDNTWLEYWRETDLICMTRKMP